MTPLELKQYRMKRGLSQGDLARDVGCSERSILTYEKPGSKIPRYLDWYVAANRAGLVLPAAVADQETV